MPPGRDFGTTPPYWACNSNWVATTEDNTVRPSATTAAAVSSQEVSMPKISMMNQQTADKRRGTQIRRSSASIGGSRFRYNGQVGLHFLQLLPANAGYFS